MAKEVKGIKVGSMVKFAIGRHGANERTGTVIMIVKPGEMPEFGAKKFKDLNKVGIGNVKVREEKSFLVQSDGALYWPQNRLLELM